MYSSVGFEVWAPTALPGQISNLVQLHQALLTARSSTHFAEIYSVASPMYSSKIKRIKYCAEISLLTGIPNVDLNKFKCSLFLLLDG